MVQAGLVYLEDGNIDNAIWTVEDGYVVVTSMSGDVIIKISEKDFRQVLTDYCNS